MTRCDWRGVSNLIAISCTIVVHVYAWAAVTGRPWAATSRLAPFIVMAAFVGIGAALVYSNSIPRCVCL